MRIADATKTKQKPKEEKSKYAMRILTMNYYYAKCSGMRR
jgi:hypothetical protein